MISRKQKSSYFQTSYELFYFLGYLSIAQAFKIGPPLVLLLFFLLIYGIEKKYISKVFFGILLGMLAFFTWAAIVSKTLNLLHTKFIINEYSLWNVFVYILIPLTMAIVTFIWSIKRRQVKRKFEIVYITALILSTLILAIQNP